MGGRIIEFEALKIKREGFQEGRQEGADDVYRTMAERMIRDGMPGDKISMFTNLGRNEIDVIATGIKHPVTWNDARA